MPVPNPATPGATPANWGAQVNGEIANVTRIALNAQTGTTFTVANADENTLVTLTNAAAITVTLPNTITTGARVDFSVLGAGMATFVGSGGATVTATPSAVSRATGSGATAIKLTATVWLVVGDLA